MSNQALDPPQIFAGFFAAIGLYNALVFFITRDRPFAWYAGLTASMVLIQGVFEPSLFGMREGVAHTLFRAAGLSAYFVCMVGFVSSYLHLREELPRVDFALKVLVPANVAGVAFEQVLPQNALHTAIDDVLFYAMLLLSLWAGVRSSTRGQEDARYYVTAFIGAIVGLAVSDLREDFHLNDVLSYAFQAGVAWEALFLALALASRVRFASFDQLTGVRNRRGFDDALALAWRTAKHEGTGLALILIDVDGFKPYNDQRGHLAGDALLRQIALLCAGCCRNRGDTFARFGGDEFAAILPRISESEAHGVADRMRTLVKQNCPVTISTGVATLKEDLAAIADLAAHADSALYAWKRKRVRSA